MYCVCGQNLWQATIKGESLVCLGNGIFMGTFDGHALWAKECYYVVLVPFQRLGQLGKHFKVRC